MKMKKSMKDVENKEEKECSKKSVEDKTIPQKKRGGKIPNLLKGLQFDIKYY